MKKTFLTIAIAGALAATSCTVDGYVDTAPADVVYTRPVTPGPDYVWIEGDWVTRNGRYEWREGHWARPRNRVWISGNWESRGGGYYWRRGYWH